MVSPGGVGYDINCGVRLLVSELSREEIDSHECRLAEDPHKNRLADALYESVPWGVGKGRRDVSFDREDLLEVLVGGPSRSSGVATGSRRISGTSSPTGGFLVLIPKRSPTGSTSAASPRLGPWGLATTFLRFST